MHRGKQMLEKKKGERNSPQPTKQKKSKARRNDIQQDKKKREKNENKLYTNRKSSVFVCMCVYVCNYVCMLHRQTTLLSEVALHVFCLLIIKMYFTMSNLP